MAGIPTTLSGIIGFVMITAFLFSLFPDSPNNKAVMDSINDISESTKFINNTVKPNSTPSVAGFGYTLLGFLLFAVSSIFLVLSLLDSWAFLVISTNPILSFAGAVITVLLVIEVAKRLTWGNH